MGDINATLDALRDLGDAVLRWIDAGIGGLFPPPEPAPRPQLVPIPVAQRGERDGRPGRRG
jgi:hypothetical protein